MDIKIFDAHIHIGSWGAQSLHGRSITPFRGRELDSPEKVLAYLNKSQIERAVLLPIYSPDKERTFRINTTVFEAARQAPSRIVPGLWVDPSPDARELLHTALRIAKEDRVHVLKTSPAAWSAPYSPDPASWDNKFKETIKMILDYAKNTRSIFQIHTGSGNSDIRLIEKLIRFAGHNVRFHLVHMGNTADGHFYFIPRLRERLREGFDIVCDTSWSRGFATRWLFDLAADDPLLSKAILFASDEPWGIFQSELAKVLDAADGNPDLLKAVLWSNAERIYTPLTP